MITSANRRITILSQMNPFLHIPICLSACQYFTPIYAEVFPFYCFMLLTEETRWIQGERSCLSLKLSKRNKSW